MKKFDRYDVADFLIVIGAVLMNVFICVSFAAFSCGSETLGGVCLVGVEIGMVLMFMSFLFV